MNGISLYPNSGYNYTSPYAAVSTAAGNTASGNSSLTGVEESKPVVNPGESTKVSPGRKSSPAECQTCKERKYQDGSDEMVSFKSAAHISPEASASTVRAHEQEHVSNAYRKAAKGGGKVISANVSLCSVPSVRNAAEAMFREVRLQRRFLIRMSRQILMPGIRNQPMPLCSSAAIWIWLYNPCLFSSIPVTASYP